MTLMGTGTHIIYGTVFRVKGQQWHTLWTVENVKSQFLLGPKRSSGLKGYAPSWEIVLHGILVVFQSPCNRLLMHLEKDGFHL